MSRDDFITLCKEKICTYINSEETYDIFTLWKDYWTIGNDRDAVPGTDNQRAIFGNTLNNKIFDCTYNALENKLYLEIFTNTDSRTYNLSTSS